MSAQRADPGAPPPSSHPARAWPTSDPRSPETPDSRDPLEPSGAPDRPPPPRLLKAPPTLAQVSQALDRSAPQMPEASLTPLLSAVGTGPAPPSRPNPAARALRPWPCDPFARRGRCVTPRRCAEQGAELTHCLRTAGGSPVLLGGSYSRLGGCPDGCPLV